jgi:DNA polymerase-3 subunit gamma/tau
VQESPEKEPSDPGESTRSPERNDDDTSLVRTRGISIKDSLKGTAVNEKLKEEAPDSGEDKEQTRAGESRPIDPGAILGAWDAYAASMEKSKPRIHSTLKNNMPEINENGVVLVRLNSEVQRDNFVKNIKSDLIKYIRESTGMDEVEVMAEVSNKTQNGKKIYTEQDKLEYLLKKNPELGKLKSRFNLDFDD